MTLEQLTFEQQFVILVFSPLALSFLGSALSLAMLWEVRRGEVSKAQATILLIIVFAAIALLLKSTAFGGGGL